ncbi:transglycosylase SLT domain-containing protein [Streptomyces polyrhachis]|uniref:Transglycosylase SLT domain-containing protein n=1 Tax=Streptomyces polyrhachis TaxID=1282885 RepID=A0ABW2GP53_9ACTN
MPGTSIRKRIATAAALAGATAALCVPLATSAQAATPQAAPQAATPQAGTPNYVPAGVTAQLDGWIDEALAVMKRHGIPGSYWGIYRNIMRESSGNPNAINNWDINARNGIPSQGLLQVIPPTFNAYHVAGTPKVITHPVSNIVAACNYAADRYGSIDNVFSAY